MRQELGDTEGDYQRTQQRPPQLPMREPSMCLYPKRESRRITGALTSSPIFTLNDRTGSKWPWQTFECAALLHHSACSSW